MERLMSVSFGNRDSTEQTSSLVQCGHTQTWPLWTHTNIDTHKHGHLHPHTHTHTHTHTVPCLKHSLSVVPQEKSFTSSCPALIPAQPTVTLLLMRGTGAWDEQMMAHMLVHTAERLLYICVC